MYLKALEIQGFKSFPDRTRLTFEKNITAIVGPNGSGKSNIADAILWVMGEQRSKALRGSKMEDVIFGGTQKRGAMGYAQVTLIIDNSAHIFDSELGEIALTRRYYRSGESEYYINREAVRLKDINSLLMDTGLGRDGYSIIGQGRIADIVSSRSTDRREVFEEAAGISRFRYRKEEAERKLEKTQENLLRINDKIEELEIQVEPLRKQSETAKKYLVLRDELRIKEVSSWMTALDRLRSQAQAVQLEYEQVCRELDGAKDTLSALYVSSDSITERMHRKDIEAERARERLSAADADTAKKQGEAGVIEANIQACRDSMARTMKDMEDAQSRAEEIKTGINGGNERLREIEEELAKISEEARANQNVQDGCRMKLQSRENRVSELNERLNLLRVDVRSTQSRINMLSEMEKDFEGFSRSVKTVMREKERGNLRGIHAPIANLIRADEECALAIETALGAAAQNIVVDSQNDGRAAIELLKRTDSGRATFQPIDAVRGSVMHDAPESDPGFVGIASELVRSDEEYAQIIRSLLGHTVVAETLADAVRIAKKSGSKYRIVTLDGQLINAGGSMTGGSSSKGTGILSRANELEKQRKQLEKQLQREKDCAGELERARTDLASVRYRMDVALEEQADIRSREASLQTEKRTTRGANDRLQALLDSISGDSDARRNAVSSYERQIEDCTARLAEKKNEIAAAELRAKGIRDEINEISKARLELEGKRSRADREAQQRNEEINSLERRKAQTEQKKLSSEMEEKSILDKLWDNYELGHSAARAICQPVENMQRLTKEIGELRRQISALGTPNIGAIEEFERVNTRYTFLTSQRDDIEKAKKELVDIISDITREMEGVFTQRFRQIDESFRETFLELFGGGKASLVLENEKDVLNCGIDIRVQPPGKALSTISLLSGGEMAFVAIALYFAILKVRPTPFCVMDEIEAALDERNVTRYAEYMRRMSDRTQFLVITHRRGTMEEADMLYGVTMEEKGVSTVIELDLEDAQKTIEQ